jgi:tellurite methyltransferase
MTQAELKPHPLLQRFADILLREAPHGPVLDLASGNCHSGIFLAQRGFDVICCDISTAALNGATKTAGTVGVQVKTRQIDLERQGLNPLPQDHFAAILVFRYLHRPLLPHLRGALQRTGFLIYETYTVEQTKFGRPHNPDFLLKPKELLDTFTGWEVIHYFEGILPDPERAIAQIVCRKPS